MSPKTQLEVIVVGSGFGGIASALRMRAMGYKVTLVEKLNKKEKSWLNNYHKTVFKNLRKSMNKTEAIELEKACSAI